MRGRLKKETYLRLRHFRGESEQTLEERPFQHERVFQQYLTKDQHTW